MAKEEELEDSVDSDPLGINKPRRIQRLSREERHREYWDFCDRIDAGRKAADLGWREARDVKDLMAQVYNIHPNSNDVRLALTGIIMVGAAGFVGYYGVIKPLIDYFSK